jgi:hypothetical protein
MITMNSRTQAMFDDNTTYPYLAEGVWFEQMPTFTDPKDLFTDQLAELEDFCVATVDLNSTALLPVWRLINTGAEDYIYSDWPIPIDLSYSDADLLTGATGNFPVGDLNWFPTQKADWEAQKEAEHTLIENAKEAGTLSIRDDANLPGKFLLRQNYPNPFNPTTTISYELTMSGLVTLKVFDVMGREVSTLVNQTQGTGNHEVVFNANNLASGIYYFSLTSQNYTVTKKMVLVR